VSEGRTLHEMTQVLESAEGSEQRTLRVLDLLRQIVPYEQCAMWLALPAREPRLIVVPDADAHERDTLKETLTHLHGMLVDERVHALAAVSRRWDSHLAVPLVANDAVIGVLFVSRATRGKTTDGYTEKHLRDFSIASGQLASYLVLVEQARQLDKARQRAESANRMKDEFLALVSHELRTPLTSTLAWAHVLGSDETGPSGRGRAIEAIERNVYAQAKLLDEILELAGIVTADLRLALKPVEPASLIRAAVAEQGLRAERKSIRLETALDESVDKIVVDPALIVQVISSLLAKAIHFTPQGGSVAVHLGRAGSRARIRVIDHGREFPPEALPQVYEQATGVLSIDRLTRIPAGVLANVLESFSAEGDPITRAYGELGVGLAVVKTVVEAHGGSVHAEGTEEEGGSAFTIELPFSLQVAGKRLLEGVRVLLVDDDADMRCLVQAVLEHEGAEVRAVDSAAAALAALEESTPHVLVSDLTMPGESGYDLMRKVKSLDATLPAAALTSLRSPDDRRRSLEAGFRIHLAKPVAAGLLVTTVATLAGRSETLPDASRHN
jgi:signal transduction histidine kinase/CheY-like chemotaxis protein